MLLKIHQLMHFNKIVLFIANLMSVFLQFLHNYYFLFLVKLQLILQLLFCNIWQDGRYYIGDYKDGVKHGKGEFHYPDGAYYIGDFKDGVRHGNGEYYYLDGRMYKGQ